jgi:hypothetical protein
LRRCKVLGTTLLWFGSQMSPRPKAQCRRSYAHSWAHREMLGTLGWGLEGRIGQWDYAPEESILSRPLSLWVSLCSPAPMSQDTSCTTYLPRGASLHCRPKGDRAKQLWTNTSETWAKVNFSSLSVVYLRHFLTVTEPWPAPPPHTQCTLYVLFNLNSHHTLIQVLLDICYASNALHSFVQIYSSIWYHYPSI